MKKLSLIILLFLFACQQDKPLANEAPVAEETPPQRETLPKATAPAARVTITADTVRYKIAEVRETLNDCDPGNPDCSHVLLQYPEIITAGESRNMLQSNIRKFLLGGTPQTEMAQSQEVMISSFLQEAEEYNQDMPEAYQMAWVSEKKITVERNTRDAFGLNMTEYISSGGAHPSMVVKYLNLDPKSGKERTLGDVLKSGYEPVLLKVAEAIFRKDKGLAAGDNFESRGFSFENNTFRLAKNYLIEEEGIKFYYNAYEIAPYAMGPTELFVPYKAITSVVR